MPISAGRVGFTQSRRHPASWNRAIKIRLFSDAKMEEENRQIEAKLLEIDQNWVAGLEANCQLEKENKKLEKEYRKLSSKWTNSCMFWSLLT